MFVIIGATGHVGGRLSEILLARGRKVRAIARHADKLAPLATRGAEARTGDVSDEKFLAEALAGATAAFAMIPPAPVVEGYQQVQNRRGEAIAAALRQAGTKRVVALSSIGAELPEGGGVVQPLFHFEKRLDQLAGASVVHLRAGYFMENLIGSLGMIKGMGIVGSPVRADLPLPMIATRDIAEAAAHELLDEKWSGHRVRYLLGARDVTYPEVARVIGEAVGKDNLAYVQFPYDQARQAMVGMGMGAAYVDALVEFVRSVNEGRVELPRQRTAENTTPTTIEQFVEQVLAPAYRAQG